jgi:hypothetical protein
LLFTALFFEEEVEEERIPDKSWERVIGPALDLPLTKAEVVEEEEIGTVLVEGARERG